MDEQLGDGDDATTGRPGYPPQLMVRMLYLSVYPNLSDRQVAEQVRDTRLYREFVGLGLEEDVPDDTTLVRFRQRVGAEGLRAVFTPLTAAAKAAGLVSEGKRVVEGTHVFAKVARRGMANFLRHGREVVCRAVAEADAAEAARLRERDAGEPAALDGDAAGRTEREAQRCTEWLAELGPQHGPAAEARAVQLQRVLQRLREPKDAKQTDAPVSFEDPDCRSATRARTSPSWATRCTTRWIRTAGSYWPSRRCRATPTRPWTWARGGPARRAGCRRARW